MQLSIIIPVKNAHATLLPCLRKMQGLTLSHEIIVVNDHSRDDSLSLAANFADTAIDLEGATGPGAARNAGVGIAQGDILLFIDSDVYTSVADIEKSYEEFIEGNYSFAVARYQPNSELSLLGRYNNYHMMYKYFDKATTRVFFSSYAMIRKECFVPFSERLKNLEDAALGHQLVQTGQVIHIFQTMAVIHHKQLGFVGLNRQFFNRSRDAVVLSWSMFRKGSSFCDDSVKNNVRLTLILVPLMALMGAFSGWAFCLLFPLFLINLSYFRYIRRFEGFPGLLVSVLIYFYTTVCCDIGMACGLVKVLSYECMAPFKISKTPLV